MTFRCTQFPSLAGTGLLAVHFMCNLCPDGGSPIPPLHLILGTSPSLSSFPPQLFLLRGPLASALLPPQSHFSAVVFKNKPNRLLNEKAVKTNKQAIIIISQPPEPQSCSREGRDKAKAQRSFLVSCAIRGLYRGTVYLGTHMFISVDTHSHIYIYTHLLKLCLIHLLV